MLLKLTFLMVFIVTLQIDLNYIYCYCKSFNITPKRLDSSLINEAVEYQDQHQFA